MTWKIIAGDALKILKRMPDNSVHCVVTSPPYYGLRDYGVDKWTGGDPDCDHKQGRPGSGRADGIVDERWQCNRDGLAALTSRVCRKCGARRIGSQIGSDSTPKKYVERLVKIFREVYRVLRRTGTVWLNLGDSFARNPGKGQHKPGDSGKEAYVYDRGGGRASCTYNAQTLTDKNIIGAPWRVAFALQGHAVIPFRAFSELAQQLTVARVFGDWATVELIEEKLRRMDLLAKLRAHGWLLRQEIIWHKPNVKPENVTDRCTKAHEYFFLLTKSPKYFYDAKAVAEAATCKRMRGPALDPCPDNSGNDGLSRRPIGETRNRRSVWSVNTFSYKGAHFATFPPTLIEPCILAGTSEKGCCPRCGAPWRRKDKDSNEWRPGCRCDASDPVPCTVLDPFVGAGTTVLVARRLGRNGIGIDLNPKYVEMARERIRSDKKEKGQ